MEENEINSGANFLNKIFIYPTDTIYGIGCDAEDKKLVDIIREIKKRDSTPFSVIAPSIEWILENCETSLEEINNYLPGPYTLLLKKKNKYFLNHVSDTEFLGVRIPKHPFIELLQKTGKPIITTSVNLSGEKPANKVGEISEEILSKVDMIFDFGELSGKPSKLVKEGKIVER
jgi:L-threonylcarbamoyladenylate synthase